MLPSTMWNGPVSGAGDALGPKQVLGVMVMIVTVVILVVMMMVFCSSERRVSKDHQQQECGENFLHNKNVARGRRG